MRFPRMVGDAVMHLPLLRLLREAGAGPLVVWGPAATVALVEDTPFADAVVPENGKPGTMEMVRMLRTHAPARCIHFPKSLRPALAAWLARVPERIGVSESGAGLLNTHTAPFWKAGGRFQDRYLAVLRQRWPELPGLPLADYDPGLPAPRPGEQYICVMPGSLWPSKAWPVAHWRELLLRARAQGLGVAVLGAPAEAEACARVAGEEGLDLCGRTTLKEAAAWLRGARAAVGNDSGLSHLAAACGTPVLALYGPTDPLGPQVWGPRVRVLRREELSCLACGRRVCPLPRRSCLEDLDAARVWESLLDLLRT